MAKRLKQCLNKKKPPAVLVIHAVRDEGGAVELQRILMKHARAERE